MISIPGFHEPVSSWSHLLGAVMFALLSFPLLRGARKGRVFLWIYCFSIVALFSVSGTYHLLQPSDGRSVMLRIDHSGIFLLIVGTMTPVYGILFRRWSRWFPLIFLWLVAATFISLVCVLYGTIPRIVWILMQLGLGWFGATAGIYLAVKRGWKFVEPLAIGGIYYTVGATINAVGWPTAIPGIVGPHEIFHVAVVAGAFHHWLFVYKVSRDSTPLSGKSSQSN